MELFSIHFTNLLSTHICFQSKTSQPSQFTKPPNSYLPPGTAIFHHYYHLYSYYQTLPKP